MKYNRLGRAGIKVSELSFGSWLTFGKDLDAKNARKLMKTAFDAGVNFFDNAEAYAGGKSESVMGDALNEFRREDLVISTKIFWGGEGPNDTGLSWKHLVEGTKAALKRLKLDYVDLLFCHRPDPNTPIEETVTALDTLVRQGYAFYWGTSEWPAEKIKEAHEFASKTNAVRPAMEQPQYNMLVRNRVEKEYSDLYRDFGMGTTIWSPLASGMLTGKYNSGVPKDSRLSEHAWLREKLTPEIIEVVKKLEPIARDLDGSLSQLAIAWCLKNPNVSTVILGARNLEQLEENLGSLSIRDKLSEEVMKEINSITAQVSI